MTTATPTFIVPTPVWEGPLTEQFYYDTTVEYLRSPNSRAIGVAATCFDSKEQCLYLNDKGLKCAIGLWIPDGHPAQRSTDLIFGLARDWPELTGTAWPDTKYGLDLGNALQVVHDDLFYRATSQGGLSERGEDKIKRIAAQYNLIYTPPQGGSNDD